MSMIGKTLGHYSVSTLLGKGGMGEVYKAKDQKLGRDVAIKVLPEEFAQETERVARFQREAKLLASLNHPNIAAIHGLEESEGTHFLVLELIEGDTLADRLKRGAIPVEEALKLALQIAEALEAAHEKGVIHRDLKPANIKVTPDGKVKVLDFGLAKAFAGEHEEVNLSQSPTLSAAATQQGVILGTAAYMSPEQARGKAVDRRTDIWAFGAVLYEMLTGKGAFQGEDVTEILAVVVKSGVDLDLLPANIHPRVREVIIRCLQKEPKKRYSGISDVQYEIEQVLSDPNGVFVQSIAVVEPRKKLRTMLLWAASLALMAIIAGVAVWMLKPAEPKRVTRFEYQVPEGQQFAGGLAVSPDGSKFVYCTTEGLYLRSMDSLDARFIPGTDGRSRQAFFSPDGQWIGYFSGTDQKLKKVAIGGGVPVTLCDAESAGGFSWSLDNRILHGIGENIMWVSSNGGEWESLIRQEGGLLGLPQMLPGGEAVMYLNAASTPYKIMVQSLKSGEQKELLEANTAQYVKTGHIVYGLEDNLYAVQFNIDALEVIGRSALLVEGVFNETSIWQYAVSDTGMLVYAHVTTRRGAILDSFSSLKSNLVWVNLQGKEEPIAADPHLYGQPKISPDGKKVAVSVITEEGASDIWILDLDRNNLVPLTRNGNSSDPLWTSDGQRIVFVSGDEDKRGIYRMAANSIGESELLGTVPDGILFPSSWSKDGKTLITTKQPAQPERAQSGIARLLQMSAGGGEFFFGAPAGLASGGNRGSRGSRGDRGRGGGRANLRFQVLNSNSDIGFLSMEGNHEWKPLLQEDYSESDPQISPDGRWIAYTSNESGQKEVWLRPFPDLNKDKKKVSVGGGSRPFWSHEGRELYYFNAGEFLAVSFAADPDVELGNPKSLFRFSGMYMTPDLSPDGKQLLVIKLGLPTDGQSAGGESILAMIPSKINIVLNWFEELKERVPLD